MEHQVRISGTLVETYFHMAIVKSQMTTIVTMFFNLQELPGVVSSTRSIDFYMKNGRGTLSAPAPMVVFCDPSTRPAIQAIREELSTHPTVYVEKNIGEYDFFQLQYAIILNNRMRSPGYKDPNDRNTPAHVLTTMFKIPALFMAYRRCDFPQSTHYMWLDFGCSHMAMDVSTAVGPIVQNPHPKISCAAIHYRSKRELYPMSEYMKWGGPCSLVGTTMTIQKEYMEQFYTAMMSIFFEQLAEGVGHTEEQVLVYLFDRHPEWFTLYFSDYRSCLVNYHRSVHDHWTIRTHFIANAIADGRHDLAAKAEASLV
jgi:hypothetical protein